MKHPFQKLLGRSLMAVAIATAGLAATSVQAQDKDPIKFATLLDFTAVYTFISVEYSQGQQDYIKMINMTGGINGHPVEMIIKDTASQPQKGIALYKQAVKKGAVLVDFLSTPIPTAFTELKLRTILRRMPGHLKPLQMLLSIL